MTNEHPPGICLNSNRYVMAVIDWRGFICIREQSVSDVDRDILIEWLGRHFSAKGKESTDD